MQWYGYNEKIGKITLPIWFAKTSKIRNKINILRVILDSKSIVIPIYRFYLTSTSLRHIATKNNFEILKNNDF